MKRVAEANGEVVEDEDGADLFLRERRRNGYDELSLNDPHATSSVFLPRITDNMKE